MKTIRRIVWSFVCACALLAIEPGIGLAEMGFGYPYSAINLPGTFDAGGGAKLDFDKLYRQLEQHEGKRAKVYQDTKKIPTIGIGFNLTRKDAPSRIEALGLDYKKVLAGEQQLNEPQIQSLFKADVDDALKASHKLVTNFDQLPDAKQRVVIDMVFNLGADGFGKFKKMIAALEKQDWKEAAAQMELSQWYKQVGDRARTLVKMMRDEK